MVSLQPSREEYQYGRTCSHPRLDRAAERLLFWPLPTTGRRQCGTLSRDTDRRFAPVGVQYLLSFNRRSLSFSYYGCRSSKP